MKIKRIRVNMFPLNAFMIRLGYLKLISIFTSIERQAYERLEKTIKHNLFWKYKVDLTKNQPIVEYIKNKKLYGKGEKRHLRYSNLIYLGNDKNQKFITEPSYLIHEYPVYFLDICLSDPKLKSHLGGISEENISEIVNWAKYTGILNKNWYNLTLRGKVLKNLIKREEKANITEKDKKIEEYWKHNPFILNNEKFFLLQILLEDDFLLISKMFQRLIKIRRFNRIKAGEIFKDCLQDILIERYKNTMNYSSLETIQQIKTLIKKIENEQKHKTKRFLTAIQRVSPRLENMVDLGLLNNNTKYSYEYEINDKTEIFANYLSTFDSYEKLNLRYWDIVNKVYKLGKKQYLEEDLLIPLIINAYNRYRRPFGDTNLYPIIQEVALNYLLTSNYFIEYQDILDFLKQLRARYPNDIHLSVGKIRDQIEFISIRREFLNKYKN